MKSVRTLVVVSDLHAGSRLGLAPAQIKLDDGGYYVPSKEQQVLKSWWDEFWTEFVPRETKGEPYEVVCNGDAVEGVPHGSVSHVSAIMDEHCHAAVDLLRPVVTAPQCSGYWHIRGTEAHVGKSAELEERVARELNAKKSKTGQHARWELWKKLGPHLIHFLHHVGTTGSAAHEASAVNAELTALLTESARWNEKTPDALVRSHRHRAIEVRVPGPKGWRFACVTPAWQLRTPFCFKVPGARVSSPQIGGVIIRSVDGYLFTIPFVKHIARDEPE